MIFSKEFHNSDRQYVIILKVGCIIHFIFYDTQLQVEHSTHMHQSLYD